MIPDYLITKAIAAANQARPGVAVVVGPDTLRDYVRAVLESHMQTLAEALALPSLNSALDIPMAVHEKAHALAHAAARRKIEVA
jgi:hypothetical protein